MKKRIIVVAGTRPNFIKIAPLMYEFAKHKDKFETLLIHTGQHYDEKMSDIFFKMLTIPEPDVNLEVNCGSHAEQTANIMVRFEKVCFDWKPHLVIVVGDVNSTLACSLVASKLNIKIAHVEAGLRSFDRTMPEEINRIVTDSLSDYLFVSEESGLRNLKRECVNSSKVHFVGNIIIDTLLSNMKVIDKSSILKKLNLAGKKYCLMTLHRPSNVDSKKSLLEIYGILKSISQKIKIVYPIHPRTKKMLKIHNFLKKFEELNNLIMVEPLGYIDFIKLVKKSKYVLTDSGGIQEETTVLGIPCLTMRENTERPITIKNGTNHLVGRNKNKILKCVKNILKDNTKQGEIPEFWDGRTAERIVKIVTDNI